MVCPKLLDSPIVLAKSKIDTVLLAVGILVDAGFNVLEVMSSDEVLSHLESRSDIRVVIADDNLAGCLSGRDIADFANQRWPIVHVILLETRRQHSQGTALWGQYTFSALVDKVFEIAMCNHVNSLRPLS